MSVMWGLTGSLDARLVVDSKSADVAFDAALRPASSSSTVGADATSLPSVGAKKRKNSASTTNPDTASAKLTAEVIVQGSINSQPFEIIRRRSAKKSELHFTVNGEVLTTQAVKDTQAVIDEVLGIQDGLLQRCCFFGQHTHTLHVSVWLNHHEHIYTCISEHYH